MVYIVVVSQSEAAPPPLNEEINLYTYQIRSRVLCTNAVSVTDDTNEKSLRRVVKYADSRVRCVKKPTLVTPEESNFH